MNKSTRLKTIFICFIWLNFVQYLLANNSIKEKHISAIVSAKWTETPLILEARYLMKNNCSRFGFKIN